MIINAIIVAAEQSSISRLRLSVQDNNIAGVKFWGKIGFKTISQCDCGHYNNLTMEYKVPTNADKVPTKYPQVFYESY